MEISLLSKQYRVRRLTEKDVSEVYRLCSKNELYYQYCPPFVSEQSIINDMKALPPKTEAKDKYYLGYYAGEKLIAVMDLIDGYPDKMTAFVGFFMVESSVQNAGIGSKIIDELCSFLKKNQIVSIRLGWVKGNPQAASFWRKNGFAETGITYDTDNYTVVVAERVL